MSVQDDTQARISHAVAEEAAVDKAAHGVLLTDVAAGKVKSLLKQEGRDDLRLRVGVQPGGCSGLVYQLYFDERSLDGDLVVDFGSVEVVIDRMSACLLYTSDAADDLMRVAPGCRRMIKKNKISHKQK